jgi:hypothetical protein
MNAKPSSGSGAPLTPAQAGRATAQSAVKLKMNGDLGGALDLLGRYFFGDETVRQIAGVDPPTPPNIEALVTPPPAPKEEPCTICGALPEDGVEKRLITRADTKTIPCPGCMGRK